MTVRRLGIIGAAVGVAAAAMIVFLATRSKDEPVLEPEPVRPTVVAPEIPKTLPTPPKPSKVVPQDQPKVEAKVAPKVTPTPKPVPSPRVSMFEDKNRKLLDHVIDRHLSGATLSKFVGADKIKSGAVGVGSGKGTGVGDATGSGTVRAGRAARGSSDPSTPPSP